MTLLRYTDGYDSFVNVYSKLLSNRLLSDGFLYSENLLNAEAELKMLQRLKITVGTSKINRMAVMLQDMKRTTDLESAYTEGKESDFRVKVLTQGFWPISNRLDLKLPQSMSVRTQAFSVFYAEKYKDRHL